MMKKHFARAAAAVLLVSPGIAGQAMAQPVVPAAPYQAVDLPLVTVSASGEVSAEPDMATVSTGVQVRAATAREAIAQNAARMKKLVDAIMAAGVERKYVQTSSISLNAQYDYRDTNNGGQPRFLGYEASNQVTVEIHDIENVGSVIDKMVAAGATSLNGPTFGISDTKVLLRQAREKALKEARARAEFYAAQSGYKNVRLVSISEGSSGYPGPVPVIVTSQRMDAAEKSVIEPGQMSVSVTLSIQYVMER